MAFVRKAAAIIKMESCIDVQDLSVMVGMSTTYTEFSVSETLIREQYYLYFIRTPAKLDEIATF